MVTAVVCMSLGRVLHLFLKFAMCLHFVSAHFYCKICLQVLAFEGKSVTYFFNMYSAHLLCRPAAGLIHYNCQIQYVVASYHNITDFIPLSDFSLEIAVALFRESYTFVQRRPFLASI